MSKIGRKPIQLGATKIEIKGSDVYYQGKNISGVHTLPYYLEAVLDGNILSVVPKTKNAIRLYKNMWGLHRSLLANKVFGSENLFEKKIQIIGLGFKATLKGSNIEFALGFSHKINFELPKGVSLEIDKTGQLLTFKSYDKELVGHVCSQVRELRRTEPYKGTGIRLTTDLVIKKAGKTK